LLNGQQQKDPKHRVKAEEHRHDIVMPVRHLEGSELRSSAGTVIPFPIMKGNLPDVWILSYTSRPTKKTHGDRVSSGRAVDFRPTPGKSQNRKVGYWEPSCREGRIKHYANTRGCTI
jgi:hypothetical protein